MDPIYDTCTDDDAMEGDGGRKGGREGVEGGGYMPTNGLVLNVFCCYCSNGGSICYCDFIHLGHVIS